MLSVVAAAALALQPAAQPEPEWRQIILVVDPALPGFRDPDPRRMPAVAVRDPGGPSPMLRCDRARYRAFVSLTDKMVFSKRNEYDSWRGVRGKVLVDGMRRYSGYFNYYPDIDAVDTAERKPAAVMQGSDVTLDLGARGTYDLVLPAVNGAFRDFAAECRKRVEAAKAAR